MQCVCVSMCSVYTGIYDSTYIRKQPSEKAPDTYKANKTHKIEKRGRTRERNNEKKNEQNKLKRASEREGNHFYIHVGRFALCGNTIGCLCYSIEKAKC